MKKHHLEMFMQMAEVAAKQSHAYRLKVGSLFVRDNRILSIGINGRVVNEPNDCEIIDEETGELITRPDVLHAEQAAMYKAARDGESLKGSTLLVTHAPCLMCSLGIHACGVKAVYYRNTYRNTEGVDFLRKHDIIVDQL